MAIADEIAAIRADGNRTDNQKRLDIYNLKIEALRDVILNGKPAPNPIPPLINRTFTLDGVTIRVNACSIVVKSGTPMLFIDVTLNGSVTHQVYYTNPPVIPRSPTGNERQDLIAAASEILAMLPVS
jgi:hypothetical protein